MRAARTTDARRSIRHQGLGDESPATRRERREEAIAGIVCSARLPRFSSLSETHRDLQGAFSIMRMTRRIVPCWLSVGLIVPASGAAKNPGVNFAALGEWWNKDPAPVRVLLDQMDSDLASGPARISSRWELSSIRSSSFSRLRTPLAPALRYRMGRVAERLMQNAKDLPAATR